MKTSRRDQNAIMSLLLEEFPPLFDDGGMDEFGGQPEHEVVMEIEPAGPVEPMMEEEPDEMYESLRGDLKKLAEFSSRLQSVCKPNGGIEPWMAAKLSRAADYVTDVYFMLDDSVDFANTGFDQAGPEQNL